MSYVDLKKAVDLLFVIAPPTINIAMLSGQFVILKRGGQFVVLKRGWQFVAGNDWTVGQFVR